MLFLIQCFHRKPIAIQHFGVSEHRIDESLNTFRKHGTIYVGDTINVVQERLTSVNWFLTKFQQSNLTFSFRRDLHNSVWSGCLLNRETLPFHCKFLEESPQWWGWWFPSHSLCFNKAEWLSWRKFRAANLRCLVYRVGVNAVFGLVFWFLIQWSQ